jgi:hypothetical protein
MHEVRPASPVPSSARRTVPDATTRSTRSMHHDAFGDGSTRRGSVSVTGTGRPSAETVQRCTVDAGVDRLAGDRAATIGRSIVPGDPRATTGRGEAGRPDPETAGVGDRGDGVRRRLDVDQRRSTGVPVADHPDRAAVGGQQHRARDRYPGDDPCRLSVDPDECAEVGGEGLGVPPVVGLEHPDASAALGLPRALPGARARFVDEPARDADRHCQGEDRLPTSVGGGDRGERLPPIPARGRGGWGAQPVLAGAVWCWGRAAS